MIASSWRRRVESALGSQCLDGDTIRPSHVEAARRAVEILCEQRVAWWPWAGGEAPATIRLDTRGLSGIYALWRDDLVVRVGAGIGVAALNDQLATMGLRLGWETATPLQSSVGGSFARGEAGVRAPASGGLRERCLGLLAVDGAARLIKGGGRVVKNVAGHDLVRLHYGARGAFGCLLELNLRIEAIPEASRCLLIECELGELRAKLESLRRPAVELEPAAQLWLDEGALAALGHSGRGALICLVEGWSEEVEEFGEAVRGETVELQRVLDLGRVGEGPRSVELRMSVRDALEFAAADDFQGGLVVDLLGGRSRVLSAALGTPQPPQSPVQQRLLARFDPHGLLRGGVSVH